MSVMPRRTNIRWRRTSAAVLPRFFFFDFFVEILNKAATSVLKGRRIVSAMHVSCIELVLVSSRLAYHLLAFSLESFLRLLRVQ
jgi:hypothetical protein